MSGQTFSTFTEVGMIDARLKTGAITLPTTTSIPYRILTLKDVYGATSFSTVTISTQTGDTFEDGTTTRAINAAWGMTTLYAGKAGTWYTIGGSVFTTASISSLTVSSIFGLTNLVSTPYLQTQLGSTVIGLGTAGYISSIPSIGGFVSSANLANLVSTANLANLVSTANLANLVSTANLANLVSTANLANHISTANLANLVSTANLANLVSTTYLATQLGSTVIGLGTVGYISSSQFLSSFNGISLNFRTSSINTNNLSAATSYVSSMVLTTLQIGTTPGFIQMGDIITTSVSTIYVASGSATIISLSAQQLYVSSIQATNIIGALVTSNLANLVSTANLATLVSTANLANHISTANLANLVSTANLANHISTANLATLVSTTYLATQLGSTVIGLGTAGYLSTIIFGPIVSTHNLTNLVSTANLANLVSTANLANLVSTANLANLVSTSYLATQLGSTVVGLGTAGYISSSQLLSTSVGLSQYISSFIDPVELTSTVIGLGTAGFVSSLGLTYAVASTAQGLGTFGYTSTSQLLSTSLGLYLQIQASATNITQSNLTSTITGLGTFGYLSTIVWGSVVSTANLANHISTANLANLVSTANLANLVSTANLANLVSTSYLATQLGSTVRGLGTAGYLSSINYSTVTLSSLTAQNLTSVQGYISSLTVDSLFLGSNSAFVDMGDIIATSLSTMQINVGIQYAVTISAQQFYVSSIQATNIIGALTTANLTSTVIGLGTAGYLSSAVTNVGGFGFVSTANLANLVSTSYFATQLTSTVIGLGTIGYLSTSTPFNGSTNQLSAGTILVSSINAVTITTSNLTVNSYETVNYNGASNVISYGSGIDTLSLKSPLTQYNGGIASLFFGTGTAGYPLARLSAVDQGTSYATSALIFQTATPAVNSNLSGISQFQYTGVNQTFTVPSGVTSISIQLWGAGGARAGSGGSGSGGAGAYLTGNLTVIPGGTYAIIVGQAGQQGSTATTYGGGGAGNAYGSSGGGRSAIQYVLPVTITAASANGTAISYTTSGAHGLFVGAIVVITNLNTAAFNVTGLVATFTTNAFTINNTATGSAVTGGSGIINQELLTVGGGGGGGYQGSGELGGYATYSGTAGAGQTALSLSPGQGGTQSAGGAGGSGSPSGGLLYGAASGINGAGGGGGGYYAGGTGGNVSAGGGGSSYTSNPLFTLVSGGNSPNLSTQAPGTASSSYIAGVAVGGTSGSGGPGLVVISAAVSYSLAESMRINNIGYLGIGTAAPQALLHVSGMTYSIQMSTQSITISSINGGTLGGILASTVTGLGTVGYISSAQLIGHVSTANLANLVSTTYLTTQLGSTVIGLGTAGYLSTAQLLSTTYGYSQNFATQNASISSLRFSTATANNAYISSLNIDQLTFGDGNGWADFGVLRALAISTLVVNTGILYATTVSTSQLIGVNFLAQSNLTSTVIGLGTVGYLSSFAGANLGNLVSTANLANLVSTANLANHISTANLANLVSTANLAGHISTANLASLISTANLASLISTANLANFVSTTYLSTQLGSTFATLTVSSLSTVNIQGTTAFISSLTVNGLFIGSNQGFVNMGDVIATSVSSLVVYAGGMYSTSNSTQQAFLSSINGVAFANIGSGGIAGIPSSLNTSSFSTFSLTGTTGFISSLTVNALFIGSNQGFVNMGDVIATSLSSLVVYTGSIFATSNQASITSTQQLNISSINGQTFGGPITSTVIGLGTAGYLSTIVWTSVVSTANLANHISTANLANLVSTANLANHISTANLANLVSTTYLATQLGSTVIGLGTAGYVSSSQLLSTTFGLNLFISTFYVDHPELLSTVAGLGSVGYLSTGFSTSISRTFLTSSLSTTNINTANVNSLTATISSLTVNALFIGTGTGFTDTGDTIGTSLSTITITANSITSISLSTQQLNVSSITGVSLLSQANLTSTVIGLGTVGYLSSALTNIGGFGLISTANLANLVSTANLANLVSTANLANLVSTANLANLVSTANLATLVSTTYLATQLGSTVRGLGTAGYLSTINYSTVILSSLTAQNLTSVQGYISALTVDAFYLGSNSAFFNMGDVIATSLSTIQINVGTQYAVTLSTQQLYVSSIQATNIIGALTTTNLTSTVIGLGTTGYISSAQLLSTSAGLSQYISSFIDPTELTSTVIGLGTAGFVSSLGLTYAVASTAQGLGTFGYTSTSQLLSTSLGLYQEIQNSPVNIKQSNVTSTIIGLGTFGYLSTVVFGSIVSTANLANLVSTANLANLVSTANLANLVSTANLANLLSTANLANLVSTANLANLVSTANLANHISTANLANHISTANLANLVSTTYLSTQLGSTFAVLNVSSFSTFSFTGTTGFMSTLTVNNLYIGSNQGFTTMGDVIGTSLSTILLYTGVEYATNIYVSSFIVSSINGQLFGTAPSIGGVISTANLANLVSTANLANLVSTANLANLVSTANLANLVSTANLANLVSTANLANHISTANLANLVSTSYLATQLGSTVRGLGTVGYLSSINYSTVLLSSLTALNLTSIQGYISSLVVDSLQLGSNTAYIYMGDVIATSLSTVYLATGSLTTTRISTPQLFVSSIAINCNTPAYALDINATFRVNSNSFFTGGVTSYLSNSGLFSNAATATFASNILQTQALAYLSNAGIFSNASNVFLTGGTTSYLSNSGLFSNVGLAYFNSNVQITQTGASISPYLSMSNYTYGSFFLGIAGSSGAYAFNTVAGDVILCASNSGNTTERMFITNNSCNNLVLSNGNVGVNCNAPAYQLDVNGTLNANNQSYLSTLSVTGIRTVTYTNNTTLGFGYGGGVGAGTRDQFRLSNATVNRDNGGGPTYYDYGAQADLVFLRKTNNLFSGGVNDMAYTEVMRVSGTSNNVGVNCNSPAYNLDVNGTFRTAGNSLFTGTYLSNSGNLSNGGFATFNAGVNIVGSALTASNSSSPVTFSNATSAANYVVKCEMTGANFIIRQSANAATIAVIENTGSGGILINPINGTGGVGIGSSNISFPLDVFGAARSGIPISSLTGTSATFANSSYGIYYYITNSAFATINLVGGAPSPAAGWYVTLRNNTGSYLSCTITGAVSSTPASPVTIPPSNSVTIAYDNATSLYVLF